MAKTDWASGDKLTAEAMNELGSAINAKAAKGDKGDKGDAGAKGADGAKGEKGDKGDTGPAGPTQFTDDEVTALKALIPDKG